MTKKMEMVPYITQMETNIKVSSQIIKKMEGEICIILMVKNIKANGKKI